MKDPEAGEKLERLVQKIDAGSRLLRAWDLKGGVSAQVTALEVEVPGGLRKRMVVRRHGEVDLKQNPHIAADEFNLLRILRSHDIRAPEPYYFDESGELFSTPLIVVEYIEGETEFAPSDLPEFLEQFTAQLAAIHNVDTSDLFFLPNIEKVYAEKFSKRPTRVDDSLDEGRIRDTLEKVWPILRSESVLLHGDYWPGNLLWKDHNLAGIIDWEDAKLGDPLADLAISRLEILWAFGVEAMHRFTHLYESMTGVDVSNLPYWDLCAALRPAFKIAEWAGSDSKEQAMREGHALFIAQAFEKLSLV